MSLTAPLDGNLKTYALPLTSTAHTLDHEKVRIGQIAHVIARHKGLLAAADVKIVRIERYLKDPGRTRITWGSPLPLQSDYIRNIERMADWRDKRRRKLDRGRGGQTIIVASEDTSKQAAYATVIVPAGAKNFEDYLDQAVSLLPAVGGEIVILEGVYIRSGDMIVARDGVKIRGQGNGTVILLDSDVGGSTKGFFAEDKRNIEITDLVIDNNLVGHFDGPWHNGARFYNVADFKIARVAVRNYIERGNSLWHSDAGGIRLENCEGGEVKECILTPNKFPPGGAGICVLNSTDISVAANRVSGTDNAIELTEVRSSVINDNVCNANWAAGIYCSGDAYDTVIVGNICCNNPPENVPMASAGILVSGEGCSVTGNVCNGNHNGLLIHGLGHSVTGNTCNDNRMHGINLSCDKVTIQANKCSGNDRNGVSIYSGSNKNIVTNNDLIDNVSGGLLDNGTDTKTTAGNRLS